ncbi:MAG: HAD family hydrolase, partial [Nitrospinota bacterium]
LLSEGFKTAVVSSSQNCAPVLRAAGIDHHFEYRVDGQVAGENNLKGKPEPDTFLFASKKLGVPPGRAVVVEDAISGVQAGKRGAFGLVIGVDRGDNSRALAKEGADIVVSDLSRLL